MVDITVNIDEIQSIREWIGIIFKEIREQGKYGVISGLNIPNDISWIIWIQFDESGLTNY